MPISPAYCPDPRHAALGPAFFDPVEAADFPAYILRFRNDRWADRLGLGTLTPVEWLDHFGRFTPLPDNLPQPLALRYHGHQFRSYNPHLGDGRGFLFAQLRERQTGRLLDLATKGSGQTPWSRAGDGRLTLKGGMREVLASERLEALGAETSKSFSLIETGEALQRGDEPSPTRSAVLVRLGHGHIRIGSFQRFAALGETENVKRLADYVIETYWPAAAEAADPIARLYALVIEAVAKTTAQWFAAGFVHGVLNTDNTMITGESFDYGPWRFLPVLDPHFTAAYFDQSGLYAFGRQPAAMAWNLARFGECLVPFSDHAALEAALGTFEPQFDAFLTRQICARLGLSAGGAMSAALVARFCAALAASRLPFERVFFDLIGGARVDRLARSPLAHHYDAEPWRTVIAALRDTEPSPGTAGILAHPYFTRDTPLTLLIEDVEALWAPIDARDDWSAFNAAIADTRAMGEAYAPLLAPSGVFSA